MQFFLRAKDSKFVSKIRSVEELKNFKQLFNETFYRDDAGTLTRFGKERMRELMDLDVDSRGPWKPQCAPQRWLTRHFHREVCLRAFELMMLDERQDENTKRQWAHDYLMVGRLPKQYYNPAFDELSAIAVGLESGEIAYRVYGQVATITSGLSHVLRLGFCLAPVVVCLNPCFCFGGKSDLKKYTIAQWRPGYCDLEKVWFKLSYFELGWGGSNVLGGSPQGKSSRLGMGEVAGVVEEFCHYSWRHWFWKVVGMASIAC